MKRTPSFPLFALFGLTRGIGGIGIGLLLADRLRRRKRKQLGKALFVVGAATTLPLLITFIRHSRRAESAGVMKPQSEVFQSTYGIVDADIEEPAPTFR